MITPYTTMIDRNHICNCSGSSGGSPSLGLRVEGIYAARIRPSERIFRGALNLEQGGNHARSTPRRYTDQGLQVEILG